MEENLLSAIENQSAYTSWDYLLKYEVIDDVPGIGLNTAELMIRHIADLEREIQLLVVSKSISDGEVNNGKGGVRRQLVAVKSLEGSSEFGGTVKFNARTKDSMYGVLKSNGVPDFRGLGLLPFPCVFNAPDNASSSLMAFNSIKASKWKYRTEVRGSDAKVVASGDVSDGTNVVGTFSSTFDIDTTTFVSKSFQLSFTPDGGTPIDNQLQLCKWGEVEDIAVPLEINIFSNAGYLPPTRNTRKAVEYEKINRLRFHWFSVNKDVRETIVEFNVNEKAKIGEMVDPILTEASNLLDVESK